MMSEAWIALIAAVFGGAGLKAVEMIFGRQERRANIQSMFRDELRQEIDSLRKELRAVDNNLTYWRERYYEVVSALNTAKYFLAEAGRPDLLSELEVNGGKSKRQQPDQD